MIKGIVFRLKALLKKIKVIPTIDEKRLIIEEYRKKYSPAIFIETGTFLGDTVAFFKNKFEQLISIELSEELALKAAKRFETDANVKIVQGNSNKVLQVILPEITKPILFWLDGHYSSEFFVGDEYIKTAKGEFNTPINEELDIIFNIKKDAIILIDDARLFNGENDYPSINAIKSKLKASNINSRVFVSNDIIHIIPIKL